MSNLMFKIEVYEYPFAPTPFLSTQTDDKREAAYLIEELADKAERIQHIKNCNSQDFCTPCGRVDKATAQL